MRYFITLLFLLITLFAKTQEAQKTDITIDDIWKNRSFVQKSVDELESMNDGLFYTALQGDTVIAKYSYKTGLKVANILTIKQLNNPLVTSFSGYQFNSDESKLIFYIHPEPIYRRSFTAPYFVWDLKAQKLYPVSGKKEQQLATLSPDGSKVAFVYKNNLYITDLATGSETAVTTDGAFNKIINGVPDWVYEEEFTYNQAFSWSPDGKYLAYCKWDESKVKVFNMTFFEGKYPDRQQNALYPENYAYKYPKAGEANSVVTAHCYELATAKTIDVNVGENTDQYIPRLLWSPKGEIVFYRLNRHQNFLEFLSADPVTGASQVFYREENKFYIDENYFDYLTFIEGGTQFIYASEKSGYLHLYLFNAKGEQLSQITLGNFDVTDYYGYNTKTQTVYYQSAESSPANRDVYSIHVTGTQKRKISQGEGINEAVFSSGFQYYINYFSNSVTPNLVTLFNQNGKVIRVLEDNQDLKDRLAEKNFSPKTFFSFTTNEDIQLNGWMIKPVDFDSTKQYPLVLIQYSGPNSQEVENSFSVGWEQTLAAKGYIVACVDPRGTGARGEQFRKLTYLQLGKYETLDLIESAKYLGTQSYIDASRIGIWGWSYGGFMALNCMTQGAEYFKAGIAVAPVTNWRYYDNIYTERYMRTPQENAEGYDLNSPINHAGELKGKLLLIHGTADDNVHLQNSVEFSEALVQANKQFEQFYYTNRNHSIYGGNTRYHLFTKMLDFFVNNL